MGRSRKLVKTGLGAESRRLRLGTALSALRFLQLHLEDLDDALHVLLLALDSLLERLEVGLHERRLVGIVLLGLVSGLL